MRAGNVPQAIVVTGAAGGIGSAIVDEILAHRADHADAAVYALDTAWTVDDLVADIPAVRRRVDVADREAVHELFAEVAAKHRLRALVNAAGVLATGDAVAVTPAQLDVLLDVNVRGVVQMATEAARTMLRQDSGPSTLAERSILTIASNSGTVPRAGFAAYGASKAAAAHFTRSLGLELGAAGVRCNVVNPGTTRTPMVDALWSGQDRTAETIAGDPQRFHTGIPLARIAEPVDIASVVAFLLSSGARHLTLGDITVDGGATAR